MPSIYTNGIGGTSGAALAQLSALYAGAIYFVHHTGSDTANAGVERARPYATLNKAATVAVAGDVIVLLAGHRETVVGASYPTVPSGVAVIGEGDGDERPCLVAAADQSVVAFGLGCLVDNIWFGAALITGGGGATVRVHARENTTFSNVRVDIGDRDAEASIEVTSTVSYTSGDALRFSPGAVRFLGVSVRNVRTSTPSAMPAIRLGTVPLEIDDLTIDGGAAGFTVPALSRLTDTNLAFVRLTNLRLLNGADMSLLPGGTGVATVGYVHVLGSSQAVKVAW